MKARDLIKDFVYNLRKLFKRLRHLPRKFVTSRKYNPSMLILVGAAALIANWTILIAVISFFTLMVLVALIDALVLWYSMTDFTEEEYF